MANWITEYKTLWLWLAGMSGVFLLASLIVIPIVIVRMRPDYFVTSHSPEAIAVEHPVLRWAALIAKNVLGVLLLISGLAMLVLPGQGLLAILVGMMLTNFPGKRALEIRLLRVPGLHRAMNCLRRKFKRPPLEIPDGV